MKSTKLHIIVCFALLTLNSGMGYASCNHYVISDSIVPHGFVPHSGFVLVRDYIPDVIEDIRYFTTDNFMGEKADGYQANVAIISERAAKQLKLAADEFREMGFLIKIYDAYRPQSAVDHFVRWSKGPDQRNKKDYYPTIEKRNLFPRYIALRSGHSKGSTIDLTICYKDTKKEVDMGSHFDYFGPPSHTSFIGAYPGGNVNKTHNKNRMLLKRVMEKHGFTNYQNEWWHYTLDNQPYPKDYFNFPVIDH
jgi:D-alanyl-D-alanine dipeptidase